MSCLAYSPFLILLRLAPGDLQASTSQASSLLTPSLRCGLIERLTFLSHAPSLLHLPLPHCRKNTAAKLPYNRGLQAEGKVWAKTRSVLCFLLSAQQDPKYNGITKLDVLRSNLTHGRLSDACKFATEVSS